MPACKLTARLEPGATSMLVDNTSAFPQTGFLNLRGEIIGYGDKTSVSFDLLDRGMRESVRRAHDSGSVVVSTTLSSPQVEIYEKVLQTVGQDIYLSPGGDIDISGQGDIVLAEGADVLSQHLLVRVTSKLGDGIDSNFGVDLANKTTDSVLELVHMVLAAVESDPEVERTAGVTQQLIGDHLIINMEVYRRGMAKAFDFSYKLQYKGAG